MPDFNSDIQQALNSLPPDFSTLDERGRIDRVKHDFMLCPVSHTLVKRSSLRGRAAHALDQVFFNSKSEKQWNAFFSDLQPRAVPRKARGDLQSTFERKIQVKAPEAVRGLWTEDSHKLRELSLLPEHCISTGKVAEISEIEQLFGLNRFMNDPIERLRSLLGFLVEKANPLQDSFNEAAQREERLAAIEENGIIPQNRSEAEGELRRFADELAKEVQGLQKRKLFFGGCGNGGALMKEHFQNFLERALPDELAKGVAQSELRAQMSDLTASFAQEMIQDLQVDRIPKSLLKEIRQVFEKGLWKAEAPRLIQKLMPNFLEKRLPAFLRLALKEELLKPLGEGPSYKVADEFLNKLCDEGFETALRDMVNGRTQGMEGQLRQLVNGVMREFSTMLPDEGVDALNCFGIGELQHSLWYELIPNDFNSVSVVVHDRGITHTYSYVDPERLDLEFFYALLNFRVRPCWDEQVSYSTQDVHEVFQALLGTEAKPAVAGKDLAMNLVNQSLKLNEDDLELSLFETRKAALIELWIESGNGTQYSETLTSAAKILLQQANSLYDKKLIDLEKFKSIYATCWEVNQAVDAARPKSGPAKVNPLLPAQVSQALGGVPEHMQTVRTLLGAAFGPEMENVIDEVLTEVCDSHAQECITVTAKKPDLPPLLRLREIIEQIIEGVLNQIWSLLFMIGCALLQIIIFGSAPETVAIATAASLLARYHPTLIAALCPQPILEAYLNAMRWMNRQVMGAAAKVLAKAFLSKELIEHINQKARHYQQKITRKGEISYFLPQIRRENPSFELPQNLGKRIARSENPLTRIEIPDAVFDSKQYTLDSLPADLKDAISHAHQLSDMSARRNFLIYFMKNLEVPSRDADSFWSRIDAPEEMMSLMTDLLFAGVGDESADVSLIEQLGRDQSEVRAIQDKMKQINVDRQEMSVCLFHLQSIVVHLSTRCPELQMEGFSMNGWELALWLHNPWNIATSLKMNDTLISLCEFYGLEVDRRYSAVEVQQLYQKSLLSYSGFGSQSGKLFGNYVYVNGVFNNLNSCVDGQYLRRFMQSSEMQTKLNALGYKKEKDQIIALFLDKHFDDLMPRSYHLLRQATFACRHVLSDKLISLKTKPHDNIFYKMNPGHIERAFGCRKLMSTFCAFWTPPADRESFHYAPWSPPAFSRWRLGAEQSLKTAMNKSPHFFTVRVWTQYDPRSLLEDTARTQTDIVSDTDKNKPLSLAHLSLQHKRLMQMIPSEKSDQLIRAFSYFKENFHLFSDWGYLKFFENLILQTGILGKQLSDRPELYFHFSDFFRQAIDYYDNSIVSPYDGRQISCLSKISVIQELLKLAAIVREFQPEKRGEFLQIERELSRMIRNGLRLEFTKWSKPFLPELFAILDIHTVSPEMICDVAELIYTVCRYCTVSDRDIHQFGPWSRKIAQLLDNDQQIRNQLLDRLSGQPSRGNWVGEYPNYQNREFAIHLLHGVVSGLKTNDHIQSEAENFVMACFEKDLTLHLASMDRFNLEDRPVYVEVENRMEAETIQLHLIRKDNEIEYEYLPSEASGGIVPPGTQGWLERDPKDGSRTLLVMDQEKLLKKLILKQGEDGKFGIVNAIEEMDGEALEEVALENISHGLTLLRWFVPEDELKVFCSAARPDRVRRIEIPSFDLSFEVQEQSDGKLRAMCKGAFAGFFISPNQVHSALQPYTHYLLLENDRGEKKVMLPARELKKEFLVQSMKSVKFLPNCRLLDDFARNYAAVEDQKNFYHYTLNDQGMLESTDQDSAAYLLLCQFARSLKFSAEVSLKQLENIGKREAFSEKTLALLDRFNLLLLSQGTREARIMSLRLAAIREENALLQSTKNSSSEWDMIWWLTTQVNYKKYLDDLQQGASPELSEFQELFLLKGISRFTGKTFKKMNKVPKFMECFGRHLAETLVMIPELSRRYRILRRKHAGLGEDVGMTEAFTGSYLSGKENLTMDLRKQMLEEGVSHSNVGKIMRLLSHPFVNSSERELHSVLCSVPRTSGNPGRCPLLSPSLVVPEDFLNSFLNYYRLARREPRDEWIQDRAALENFEEQTREFKRLILATQGKYEPKVQMMIEILRFVAMSDSPDLYPKVEELEGPWEFGPLTQKQADICNKLFERCESDFRWNALKQMRPLAASFAGNVIMTKILSKATYYITGSSILGTLYFAFNKARDLAGPIQDTAEVIREKMQGPAESELSVKEGPLPEELAQVLTKQDHAAGSALKQICKKYLRNESYKEDYAKQKLAPHLDKLNQGLEDYYARGEETKQRYSVLDAEKMTHLKSLLECLVEEFREKIEQGEAELLAFVNQEPIDERGEEELLRDAIRNASYAKDPLSWDSLCHMFITGDRQALAARSSLDEEQAQQVFDALNEHHLLITRCQQAERALEKASLLQNDSSKDQRLFDEIGQELNRDRAYDFSANSRLLRAFLLFESRSEKMLWEKQVRQISTLLTEDQDAVVELIMGSGKTYFGIPTTDFFEADGHQAVINIWPAPVAKTNIEQISGQSNAIFGQTANAKHISRGIGLSSNKMWALLKVLTRTSIERAQLNMTKEDAQALELNFIEQLYRHAYPEQDGKRAKESSIEFLRKSLLWIRTRGKASVDEAHEIFNRRKELNYPLGKPKKVRDDFVRVVTACVRTLVSEPEISALLRIKENRQNELTEEQYEKRVLPCVARALCSKLKILAVSPEEMDEVVQYLCDPQSPPPSFIRNSPRRVHLALARGILTGILPNVLKRVVNVNYGPSKIADREYAIPYAGNNNPLENASIRNPFETLLKTELMYLHQRLSLKQSTRLIKWMRKQGKIQAKRQGIPLKNTRAARFFAKWTQEADLFAAKPDYLALRDQLNQKDEAVLYFTQKFVAPQIKYYTENIRSDSHNFASMFANCYGDTGTPYNHETFPLGMKMHWDKGTMGETLDLLLKKCSASDRVQLLQSELPKEILTEMLHTHFKGSGSEQRRALIDCGALLRGMSTDKVAKQMMSFMQEERPDLKGVVYYASGELVILENGSKKAIPLRESSIRPEERITYFDQPHTFASDIPQGLRAEAVVTVGEQLTLEGGLSQAVWRMRGLKTEQQGLLFVIPQSVRALMNGERIQDIIEFTSRNESEQLAEDNYLADRQKIANIARRAVLDQILKAKTFSGALSLFKLCKDFLIDETVEDPYKLYGLAELPEDPKTALEQYKLLTLARLMATGLFFDKDLEPFKAQLAQVGSSLYPDKVSRIDDLDKEQECEQNQENEQEMEQENELQRELEQDRMSQQYIAPSKTKAPPYEEWNESIDLSTTNWLSGNGSGTALFPLKEALQKSRDPSIRAIAPHLSGRVLCSGNFLPQKTEPCGPFQKPVLEMLVVQENERVTMVLLDQQDAAFWRKKLARDRKEGCQNQSVKMGLYDLGLRAFVATGASKFDEKELQKKLLFVRQETQVKFFNGDVDYTTDQIKAFGLWAKKLGLRKVQAAFEAIFAQMAHQSYEGSALENFFMSEDMDITI